MAVAWGICCVCAQCKSCSPGSAGRAGASIKQFAWGPWRRRDSLAVSTRATCGLAGPGGPSGGGGPSLSYPPSVAAGTAFARPTSVATGAALARPTSTTTSRALYRLGVAGVASNAIASPASCSAPYSCRNAII